MNFAAAIQSPRQLTLIMVIILDNWVDMTEYFGRRQSKAMISLEDIMDPPEDGSFLPCPQVSVLLMIFLPDWLCVTASAHACGYPLACDLAFRLPALLVLLLYLDLTDIINDFLI